jgi:hypothetical protein
MAGWGGFAPPLAIELTLARFMPTHRSTTPVP